MNWGEIWDTVWNLLNSSIFGLLTGLFLGNLSKKIGKISYTYVSTKSEFSEEQYSDLKEIEPQNFVIDIVNNKGINLVINNIKMIYNDTSGKKKVNNVLRARAKGFDTGPINIPPHTGQRIMLNGSRIPQDNDIISLWANGREETIIIKN